MDGNMQTSTAFSDKNQNFQWNPVAKQFQNEYTRFFIRSTRYYTWRYLNFHIYSSDQKLGGHPWRWHRWNCFNYQSAWTFNISWKWVYSEIRRSGWWDVLRCWGYLSSRVERRRANYGTQARSKLWRACAFEPWHTAKEGFGSITNHGESCSINSRKIQRNWNSVSTV